LNDSKLAQRLWLVSTQIVQRITNATGINAGSYLMRREVVRTLIY
jgi:hypothetical protein